MSNMKCPLKVRQKTFRGHFTICATPFLLKRAIRFARLFVQGFYFEQDRLIVCFICFVGRGDSIFQ